MGLWKVEVAGVSHRFVEANTREEAIDRVREGLIQALELRATRAPRELDEAYANAGRNQRARLIASLDGLSAPRRTPQSIKDRIETLQRELVTQEQWIEDKLSYAPSATPERVRRIAVAVELHRLSQAQAYRRMIEQSKGDT